MCVWTGNLSSYLLIDKSLFFWELYSQMKMLARDFMKLNTVEPML